MAIRPRSGERSYGLGERSYGLREHGYGLRERSYDCPFHWPAEYV